MKIIKHFTLLLFAAVFTLASCKKDDPVDSPSPPGAKNNEINTKINSSEWTGIIYSWAVTGGTRQINADATDSTSIQIFMPVDTTGTFNAADNIVTLSYRNNNVTWSNNISGQVVITANTDDHIEGTFSLVVASYFNSDTLTFTEGSFYFK